MSDDQDPLKYLTLDTDELGIWLVNETPEGPQQMGHISWMAIKQGVQTALFQEQFSMALDKLDAEEALLDVE